VWGAAFTAALAFLIIVGVIVILRVWLLTATMNAFLGGEETVILPAAIASAVCVALNTGLLRYLYPMERR